MFLKTQEKSAICMFFCVIRRHLFTTDLYLGDFLVGDEGVEDPERNVGEEKECDDLSARFSCLLGPCHTNTSPSLANYHSLKNSLFHSGSDFKK